MKSIKIILKDLVLFLVCILFLNVGFAKDDNENIVDVINFINDENNWNKHKHIAHIVYKDDEIVKYIELLSAIRCDDPQFVKQLAQKFDYWYSDSMLRDRHGYFASIRARHEFVANACICIDLPTLEGILDIVANLPKTRILKKIGDNTYKPGDEKFDPEMTFKCVRYFRALFPYESTVALIDNRIQNSQSSTKTKENIESLQYFREFYKPPDDVKIKRLYIYSGWSDFTLNHPLYKARQLAIKTNLELAQRILNSNKNLSLIDAESKLQLLAAVEELAKVRAIEAVEVLAPILLLQSNKEIANLDKKYFSLQKYPVGIALVKIGIPSIWGLLDEVAKRSDNADEYRKIAHHVMTTILIEKAISGFVNEVLNKYKDDELAQIRLAKLLLLLGEDTDKIALLKPQFRTWKTTDGLFETNAKFISLDKNNEVKLEKENGNKTTIELHDLQKNDQDYVKEFITINKKHK